MLMFSFQDIFCEKMQKCVHFKNLIISLNFSENVHNACKIAIEQPVLLSLQINCAFALQTAMVGFVSLLGICNYGYTFTSVHEKC